MLVAPVDRTANQEDDIKRMRSSRGIYWAAAVATLSAGLCVAQYERTGGWRRGGSDAGPIVQTEGGELVNEDTVRTARETPNHSTTTPNWTNAPGFDKDVFTFARIVFRSGYRARGYRPSWLGWINDYPDSDLNLSYRLQQLTSLRVDPDGRVLKLTDSALTEFPLIYMVQPGGLELREEEAAILRKYLFNGGVLFADDFWGTAEWDNFELQMKRVLPERHWVELDMSHQLFHSVFDFKGPMNNLQVPSTFFWRRTYDPSNPHAHASAYRGEGSEDMHVRAWLDDQQRIMVVATFNTDNGDGWEREGENEVYFHDFCESRAYPLAINIFFYLMTH